MYINSKDGITLDNLCRFYCKKAKLYGFGRSVNSVISKAEAISKKC